MTPEIKFARSLVQKYLNNNNEPTSEGLNELAMLLNEEQENKYTVLLNHCKAIRNILNEAIKQMESGEE
ncbi:MAG: hypothetical protein KBT03_07675 [Bacteroidales bacterium]|nr:hypothetical protein [Candidatus Scybalousia scybalohippi]